MDNQEGQSIAEAKLDDKEFLSWKDNIERNLSELDLKAFLNIFSTRDSVVDRADIMEELVYNRFAKLKLI